MLFSGEVAPMSEKPAPKTMDSLRAIAQRTSVDASYTYDSGRLVDEKLRFIADNCPSVLDVGKSTRERFSIFRPGQAVTMDINQYGDYPDVVDDLCDVRNLEWSSFNAIVCFSILEHVYAPHLACENLHRLLRPGDSSLSMSRSCSATTRRPTVATRTTSGSAWTRWGTCSRTSRK